jgi:radical SAM protein with 4Fe4S-binding SPASM domain
MIPVSVMVTGAGTVSIKIKGRFSVDRPSDFSSPIRPVISWNITRRCNLRCLHCYIDAGSPDKGELTTGEALNLIDQFSQIGVPLILFTGGEPLMRGDLFELASYARGRGIKIALSTNGTLITREAASKLADSGFSYIGVSLDSINSEFHDEFRGVKGAFAMAIAGIRNALDAGLDVGLRFTLTSRNIDEVPSYIEFALSLGVRRITFYHLSASGRARNLNRDWWYSPGQYTRFMDNLIKYAREYAGKLEIETTLGPFDGIYIALSLAKGSSELENYLKFVESTGGCGRRIISIYPNGDVYPCQFIDFVKLGNVREKSLIEILSESNLDLFINTEKYLRGPQCSNCQFKRYCKGGDRARAYYLGGDLYGDDPLCPIPHILNGFKQA